jgi:hypothetical protein
MGLSWRLTAGLSPIALFFPSTNLLHLLDKTSLIEASRLEGSVEGLLFRQGVLGFEMKLEQHDHCYDDRATHERYLLLQIGASGFGWKQNIETIDPNKISNKYHSGQARHPWYLSVCNVSTTLIRR